MIPFTSSAPNRRRHSCGWAGARPTPLPRGKGFVWNLCWSLWRRSLPFGSSLFPLLCMAERRMRGKKRLILQAFNYCISQTVVTTVPVEGMLLAKGKPEPLPRFWQAAEGGCSWLGSCGCNRNHREATEQWGASSDCSGNQNQLGLKRAFSLPADWKENKHHDD